jgi:hypothetical protein
MGKTALLAAAAVFAFAGQADAAQTANVSLDALCNVFTITTQDAGHLAAAIETDPDGRCETFLGEGRVARTKDLGRIADVSGNFNSNASAVFTIDVQFPFVTGGAWQEYETTDGVHMQFVTSGTYTVLGPSAVLRQTGKRLTDFAPPSR